MSDFLFYKEPVTTARKVRAPAAINPISKSIQNLSKEALGFTTMGCCESDFRDVL